MYYALRYYGIGGVPLPWSSRPRTINYKYNESQMSKQKLKKKMESEVSVKLIQPKP